MVWSDQPMTMPRASTMLYKELLHAGTQVENQNGSEGNLPSSSMSHDKYRTINITKEDISDNRQLQREAAKQSAVCEKDISPEARKRVLQFIQDSLAAIGSLEQDIESKHTSLRESQDSECADEDKGSENSLSVLLSLLGTLSRDLENVEASLRNVCRRLTKGVADALYQAVKNDHHEVGQLLRPLLSKAGELFKIYGGIDEGAISRVDGIRCGESPVLKARDTEGFLLPAESIPEVLGISVDRSLLNKKSNRRKQTTAVSKAKNAKTKRVRWLSDGVCWDGKLQLQLAQVLRFALRQDCDMSQFSLSSRFQKFSYKLKNSGACQGLALMGATLDEVCSTLEVGGFEDAEEFLGGLDSSSKEAAEAYVAREKPDIRKGKLLGSVDAFVNLIAELMDDVVGFSSISQKKGRRCKQVVESCMENGHDANKQPVKLPKSIAANREPFRHGEWRKTPFKPRPYVRLEKYDIVEEFQRSQIEQKLKTSKRGGCDGLHCTERHGLGEYSLEKDGFATSCNCLAHNTECDENCSCTSPQCLNRAVSNRNAVKLGVDVEEINSWGMDCYTRRNIQDAILESQAFGSYQPPDYDKIVTSAVAADTSAGQHAAMAADAPSPDIDSNFLQLIPNHEYVQRAASDWIEQVLMPAINKQGDDGWDLKRAIEHVLLKAQENSDSRSQISAKAIQDRFDAVGPNYFRIHPKGVGLVCKRPAGIPKLTFIEEYLGEIHTPWRWFELQDAVKRITGSELPDFYNIVLERPKDDPAGYDVLFVDAAAKGAVASRMSHSCTPNCQAVVMACNGRLTIALYTLREVHEGEELTFDYSSVTESEKEFRQAICLCGTHMCRGSYLYFTGSRAFMQILSKKHNVLHRQVMLARAGAEPLTSDDAERLTKFGLGGSCMGSSTSGDRVPVWLEKWTSLVCEYLELEERCLKEELLERDPYKRYTEATAAAEAKGVVSNRLQNIVITLDKVRMFLSQPDQPQEPCLRILSEVEAKEHLWSGQRSVMKRILKGSLQLIAPIETMHLRDNFEVKDILDGGGRHRQQILPKNCIRILEAAREDAVSYQDARSKFLKLLEILREIDNEIEGGLTAVVDIGILYAYTSIWVTPGKGYKTVTSPKVPINLEDLFLNREGEDDENISDEKLKSAAHNLAKQHAKNPALKKIYRPTYVWGQLSGWFKQTVNDPTASLSAERRGALSLPDIESCFGDPTRYGLKERMEMLDQISNRPDSMWKTGTIWSFKNDAKVYGTPMLDQAWFEITGQGENSVSKVLEKLKSAKIPLKAITKTPRGSKTQPHPPGSSTGSKRKSKGSNSKNSDIYVTFE